MSKDTNYIFGHPDYLKKEEFTLERFRISLQKIISKDLIKNYQDSMEVQVILMEWRDEVRVRFFRDLACMKQEKKIVFWTPKTWWDHFKMQHRKNWLIKKFKPLQMAKHYYEIKQMLVFPDFRIPRGNDFKNYFKITQARLIK